jgi:hypothetical protein
MAEQQQFDWQKETAKCVEGLKFDTEQDYKFELVSEEVSLHTIGKEAPVLFKKGPKAGTPVKMYTFPFREVESNVMFKLEFFHNDSYKINPTNPELEDDLVRLSRKVGYNPVLDGNFTVADFVKPGLAFTAKLCFQKPTKAGQKVDEARGVVVNAAGEEVGKAYKTIDIDTIVMSDGSSSGQGTLPEPINADDEKAVLALAKGCKKFSELVSKINKEKRKDELLDVSMRMKEKGTLKF